ncbi:MAG: ABC transporter ATP-binding protein [Pseudomonadota bacterium]
MQLEIRDIDASYGGNNVLHQVCLQLDSGEIAALLGPSGCGKTTVLRCVAGFESVAAGEIHIDDKLVSGNKHHVPPEERSIGMVFQDYALLPHLTALQNVMFGLHRLAESDRRAKAQEYLEIVGLGASTGAYPAELSGGEQQRVALARALAPGPRLLLMDEPFSNLDADMRERLGLDVRQIIESLSITTLLVTHDQREAFSFADKIAVLKKGRVQQIGSPRELYQKPASSFVADFVGAGFFLSGNAMASNQVETQLGVFAIENAVTKPSKVLVLMRPEDVAVDPDSTIRGELVGKVFTGRDHILRLRLASGEMVQSYDSLESHLSVGEQVGLRYTQNQVLVFTPDQEQ